MDEEKRIQSSYLGTGWGFPPTFRKEKRGVVMIADEEDIQSSLKILLTTRIGERILQPKYGCDLSKLLFEPVDLTLKTYITGLIKDAILYFEPRIKLEKIELAARELEGVIEITIVYLIKGTNSRFNYVYPFYLEEGSSIGS